MPKDFLKPGYGRNSYADLHLHRIVFKFKNMYTVLCACARPTIKIIWNNYNTIIH